MVYDPRRSPPPRPFRQGELTRIGETVHAIGLALADCRHAGIDPEADPAVILLARRLGQLCELRHSNGLLQRMCAQPWLMPAQGVGASGANARG